MVSPCEAQALKPRADDGSVTPLDFCGDDDDGMFDEFMDEDLATDDSRAEFVDCAPASRLIEMALEDRHLKSALADFEQYDELEYFGDDMAAEYSH